MNRCNPFCGKASSEYHLKVTQLLRHESPIFKKMGFSFAQCTFFSQLLQIYKKIWLHAFKIKGLQPI
tara:strand:+ start:194 stop:394 length:201 start_codon:yes stop_codon:yes gene_type:complete